MKRRLSTIGDSVGVSMNVLWGTAEIDPGFRRTVPRGDHIANDAVAATKFSPDTVDSLRNTHCDAMETEVSFYGE